MAAIFTEITAEGQTAGSTPWEWTSIVEAGSNVFHPINTDAYEGSECYEATFDGSNLNCYGLKSFTSENEVYFDFWIKISSDFEFGGTYQRTTFFALYSSSSYVVEVAAYGYGSTTPNRWYFRDRTGSGTDATNFALNTWKHVQIYYLRGASSDGIVQIWIDGTLLWDNQSITINYGIDDIRGGGSGGNAPVAGNFRLDSINGYDSIPAAGAIMNQLQFNNLGADLFNGSLL